MRISTFVAIALAACGCAVALVGGTSGDSSTEELPLDGLVPSAERPSPPVNPVAVAPPAVAPVPLGDTGDTPEGLAVETPEVPAPQPAPRIVPPRPAASLDQVVSYPDGKAMRRAWVDPRVLVEFGAKRGHRPPVAGAQLLRDGRNRVWQVPEGVNAANEAVAQVAAGDARYAVALRTGPSSASGLRAAAPGLMVRFKADWDQADRNAFAERHGLTTEKRIQRGPGWYSYLGIVGLDAIRLANALRESGEVLDVSRNWWRPVVSK